MIDKGIADKATADAMIDDAEADPGAK